MQDFVCKLGIYALFKPILPLRKAFCACPAPFSGSAVYPFYILHQTVTIVLAYTLKPVALPFFLKFGLLCAGTLLVCGMLYELLMKAGLGIFFGVKAGNDSKQ